MSINYTPRTWTSGEVVTAAFMNTEVRDALTGLQAAWTSYTPTWTGSVTNPTIGNGTLTGRNLRMGKSLLFRVVMAAGTTTTVGSGTYAFALPAAVHATGEQTVSADFYDGANHYACTGLVAQGASVVNPFSTKGGTSGSQIQLGSTSFAAGTLAIIVCEGALELA